jgi:hypothetical protein
MDPRMSFKQLADETLAEAWEHYHSFMKDLPTASIEVWEFNQGFYCGLLQEAKEHIDVIAGGTFFILNTERESEKYGLKENSRPIKIDPLTRKF